MKSFFQIYKTALLSCKGFSLFFISFFYSAFISYISQVFLPHTIYVTSPLMCLFSLPLSGICIWFFKNGTKKLKLLICLCLLPSVSWLLCAGAVYAYSSFFGGEFFFSLSLFMYSLTSSASSAILGAASLLTLLIYKKTVVHKESFRK